MEALVEMTLAAGGASRPRAVKLEALKDGGLPCVR